MNEAANILEITDSMVKQMTNEVLRMISISLQYSVTTSDFDRLQHMFEAAGFMVGINSQIGKTFNITITYLRNWG